ncbi:FkbM family methyltransferase [Aliarcobacter skirrowii]|uniref:FkbM family methyltransferase n=1 Tax=Aliarcobacter skirrowii TaxID=28200 RepID=A0AAW9DB39_9BACT|nr:FkbM family methyltransferase [Aliarcobacter skirrowii]MDX4069419.1 FkbM family methyltransferase [Aliarcobacter skirrowii]
MKYYLKKLLETKELSQEEIELNKAEYRYGANTPNEIRYGFIEYYLRKLDDFEKAKQLFDNNESKELFDILILFKSLGHRYIKLPRNTDNYQEFIKRVNSKPINATILEEKFRPMAHKYINKYKLDDYNLELFTTDGFLINFLYNKQYSYRNDVEIKVLENDVILDCGSCWGDNALYFAKQVGMGGQIVAFEFDDNNLEIFYKNLEINPDIKNITIIKNALDNKEGRELNFISNDGGTHISDKGENPVKTTTIDKTVKDLNLEKVDFIKMDIEGFELQALEGAINTLKEFKPKLAISLYHKYKDFVEIPCWIKTNFPEYKIYLDHHTIHGEETVLYAISDFGYNHE